MPVLINVGTMTNAMRAKRVLEQHGIRANVRRSTPKSGEQGCGYSVLVPSYSPEITALLRDAGIAIQSIKGRGPV